MTDTYSQVKEQLDGIVEQVRKKDVSLERSLDLLEEGVALANRCTELIDQAAWEDAEDLDVEASDAVSDAIQDAVAESDQDEVSVDDSDEDAADEEIAEDAVENTNSDDTQAVDDDEPAA